MEEAQAHNGRVACNNHDQYYYGPFYFLREAVNAILKCLGLGSTSKAKEYYCSDQEDHDQKNNQQSCSQDHQSSSTETASPTNDSSIAEDLSARGGRPPPRPPVNGGPDPQTNSKPSS